ncbi:regulatory helix-turn-helix LysR family protein [Brenneria salicis ATCC 15712 = DSM 30166]|nr:regulatory helix-turn-helix LysR family protein [Brenneria salicis ATCC 15712 = DSM 30166]
MRLRHIEIFQAIVQAGTISGAARLLNVSQPNVSRVLSHAEQQLGFALFERHAQGMVVTSEGRRLIPKVQELFSQLHNISLLTEQIKTGKEQ